MLTFIFCAGSAETFHQNLFCTLKLSFRGADRQTMPIAHLSYAADVMTLHLEYSFLNETLIICSQYSSGSV